MIRVRNVTSGSRRAGRSFATGRHADDSVELSEEISRVGVRVFMVLATLIGLWGLLCLASGLKLCGGVSALAADWLSCVLGG